MHSISHLLDLYKANYATSHEAAVKSVYDLGVDYGYQKAQASPPQGELDIESLVVDPLPPIDPPPPIEPNAGL